MNRFRQDTQTARQQADDGFEQSQKRCSQYGAPGRVLLFFLCDRRRYSRHVCYPRVQS